MGENFTLADLVEEQVCVGDVIRVGSAVVQVSGPRVPCANLARRFGRGDWVRLTIGENRTGFYLRVLHPGLVREGYAGSLEERIHPNGAIPAINRCMYLEFDAAAAETFASMSGLEEWWRAQLREKLTWRSHWSDDVAR